MPVSGRSASSALPLPRTAARLASISWTACLASDTVTESTANLGCQDPSLKGSHCQSLSPPFLLPALVCFFAPCSPSFNQRRLLLTSPHTSTSHRLTALSTFQ